MKREQALLAFSPWFFFLPGHRVMTEYYNRRGQVTFTAGSDKIQKNKLERLLSFTTTGADKSRSQPEATRYKKANWSLLCRLFDMRMFFQIGCEYFI